MNTNTKILNAEYFKNKFAKHDASFQEIIGDRVIPKTSSRKKRNYNDTFGNNPPYTRFTDETE